MNKRPYTETILIVEDTDFMAEVMKEIFTAEGYRVFWARNGEEALKMYPELLPDLVTLDIVMPGLDGIEVLGELWKSDPSCRVIMVSAVGLESKVLEAIRMGAKNFVVKPFDKEKVLKATHQALNEY
jgi:two-component system chemotaxis response regulator CheY